MTNNSRLAFYTAVIGTVLVLGLSFSPALGQEPDEIHHNHGWYSSESRSRAGGYMPSVTDSTRLLRVDKVGINRATNHDEDKDSMMLFPIYVQHEQSSQPKYNTHTQINRDYQENIESPGGLRRNARLEATTTTNTTTNTTAIIKTDKSEYYDGENIVGVYNTTSLGGLCDGTTSRCWVALFPHDAVDYSHPNLKLDVQVLSDQTAGSVSLPTRSIPAVNSKFKVVIAFEGSDQVRILGVSNAFAVLAISAVLATDKTEYIDGELINVRYTMNQMAHNLENGFAMIALFEHNVSNYSLPPATWWNDKILDNTGSIALSSRYLPVLNTKCKAVMAVSGSDPLRILGVSSPFNILPNSAALATDKTQYLEGELIIVTYTMNKTMHNLEDNFAMIALFLQNVSDYSFDSDATTWWNTWISGNSGDVLLSSRDLPVLNTKYKAVMAISGSAPIRILGVSNNFTFLSNSATLVTDKTEYFDGEVIDVTYTTNQTAHNLEDGFAMITLLAHNFSIDSLDASPWWDNRISDIAGSVALSTRYLPFLNSKYKAVMAISGSDPLRILGVSNIFTFLPNSATLATDRTQYFEGEIVNVTYTMNEMAHKLEHGFVMIALFTHNVSVYSLDAASGWNYRISNNTGTVKFSSTNLPIYNIKYKAVMAVSWSDPLRILGVSNTFNFLPNSAALATERSQYVEGELIDVTYTINKMSHNLEEYLPMFALFANNSSNYSSRRANWWNFRISGNTGRVELSSRNLPVLNTKYKAVMAISRSDPIRILGVSDAFTVLPNSAALSTAKTEYVDGEVIDVTYTINKMAHNLEGDFATLALFHSNVSDYSTAPSIWWNVRISDNVGSVALSSRYLPVLNTKCKAVMAISGSNPLRILGVSNPFNVVPNSASLATDKNQYFEGELIDVTYALIRKAHNLEGGYATIAVFLHNISDYSSPPTTWWNDYVSNNTGSVALSSRYLPVLNKYKVVMAIYASDPPRILGVSNTFHVLPLSAALVTDKIEYLDGEVINVTFATNETASNLENGFATMAVFVHNILDYSSPPAAWSNDRISDITGSIALSSRYLPVLNTKYRAIMVISGSDPLRILGVSNAFNVVPNSAALATDKNQYFEGELIDVTYALIRKAHNLEGAFAGIGFFAHNLSDNSLTPPAWWISVISNNTGTVTLSSRNLPSLNIKYNAVMAISGLYPLRILGVSNAYFIHRSSAAVATDKTQFYEGEMIDVTYTMNDVTHNLEAGFAWVALFAANNVSEYTVSTAMSLYLSNSSEKKGTIRVSTLNLPDLNSKYKAVMAIAHSDPLRIIGVSDAFAVLPNSATLVTDKSQYLEGTIVYVTYTLPSTVENLEKGFAWVGLIQQNIHNYSVLPLARSPSSSSKKSDTIAVSTMNLPLLNTTYKAVMGITDSKPPRILGISQPFRILPPKWPHPPDKTSAKWNFKDIQAVFVGNDLMRCEGRANIAPANRSKCSPRRTCFFGNQNCTAVGAFPATRCSCRGTGSKKTWSCISAVCPKSKNDPII